MSESNDVCAHCGAPRAPGYAACKFCNTVFAREKQTSLQDNAVPCPKCRTLNEWGAQKCVQCQSWVVVQCVFCSSLSPHHVPACLKCQEAFAGAPERFQQRQQQQQGQQRMQMLGSVGSVAASFLGAAAGVAVSGAFSGQGHRYEGHHHGHRASFDNENGRDRDYTSGNNGNDGNDGGGLMDSLFGSSDTSSSNESTGDAGGDGGGLMDDVFSSDSSDD
jgi:phage FluMu protein Com